MKNFEVLDVNELFLEKNKFEVLDQSYQAEGLETPEMVLDALAQITQEIKHRIQGDLERRLRTAKLRRDSLKTAREQRGDLDREIESLEKRLV